MKYYLGIDIGSVSTNVIAMDENYNVCFSQYIRANGQPLESVKKGMKMLKDAIGCEDDDILGIGTTGSGRELAGVLVGADVIKNEITAHATATLHYHPDARTIFEIGGQDSKIIILQDGMVTDFAMNTVCAAGTGSFLDHQAERLGVPIEQFGELALTAEKDVRIAGRCTVFAESDMIAKQQYGFSKAEIIKGLCTALVRNYINNLGRAKTLKPPFIFQGGVAANVGIRKAFEDEVGEKVVIPKYYNVMGAIGSAILAKEYIEDNQIEKPSFKGFGQLELEFKPTSFECRGCSNMCEVIRVISSDNEVLAVWGDKCGKYAGTSKASRTAGR